MAVLATVMSSSVVTGNVSEASLHLNGAEAWTPLFCEQGDASWLTGDGDRAGPSRTFFYKAYRFRRAIFGDTTAQKSGFLAGHCHYSQARSRRFFKRAAMRRMSPVSRLWSRKIHAMMV
jgi:hypothetical protein